MASSSRHLNCGAVLHMIDNSDDSEDDCDLNEPMCDGSDEEFPEPDDHENNER